MLEIYLSELNFLFIAFIFLFAIFYLLKKLKTVENTWLNFVP
jgi:hypothetical protein